MNGNANYVCGGWMAKTPDQTRNRAVAAPIVIRGSGAARTGNRASRRPCRTLRTAARAASVPVAGSTASSSSRPTGRARRRRVGRAPNTRPTRCKNDVPHVMSVLVVDVLEVGDIEQQQRVGLGLPRGPGP